LGYFIQRLILCINFDKKWDGLRFGRFFQTPSGHPACKKIGWGGNVSGNPSEVTTPPSAAMKFAGG
jgi:hypothetical protein